MRHPSLRWGLSALLLLVLQLVLFGQNQNPRPASPRNDDIEEKQAPPADQGVATAPPDFLNAESDTPDVPDFARGLIDTETYLRLRNEQIRLMRGQMDRLYDPRSRNQAIRDMRDAERQLRQAIQQRQNGNAPTPDGTGGTGGVSNNGPLGPSLLTPWTPLGPSPIPNGQTTGVSQAVSGRVTTIVVHPTNENIIYVGAAQGGVYRSLNGGTTWTPILDDALTLSIGSLALDPLDPTTLFVGTGEGNLSADSFFGVGLYIIKHADSAPEVHGPFNLDGSSNDVFTGRAITRVLVSPTDDNIVFVSTTSGIGGIGADSVPSVIAANLPSRGLYRSTNAMSANPTFSKITVQSANGGNRGITDIAFGATPNILIAGVNGFSTGGNDGGIWRTTNAFDAVPTFTNQVVVGTATATIQIKFASNTVSGVTTMLAATGESPVPNGSNCGAPGWVRRSTDGGVTWGLGLIQTSGFCNTQCFYDMAPAMDPTNSNIIYLGGSANADTNPPRATCRSNVLTRSLDGTNFTRIDTGLHADTHAVAVAPSNPNVVYFGSDGGVWRSSNQGTTWSSINTAGFNATQFQSISLHPSDRNFSIGGTQDNGTPFLHPDTTWTRADFGDGGFALIDQSAADTTSVTMYHTYFNQSNNLIGYARVTTTANAHDNGWGFFGCNGTVANNGFRCADSVLFYAPMALGPGTPNTLYFGTDRLYRSANQGTTMVPVSVNASNVPAALVAGTPISAIGISPQNDNVRIVGLRNGKIFATTTGTLTVGTSDVTGAGMPAKYVSRAIIDPHDVNTAYVAFSGFGIAGKQIWKTTNLNATPPTWTNAAAGLPDVPVNALVVDPLDSRVVYAGSDIGVFISTDGGGSWNPFGTGLPRVAVFDMAIQSPNRVLRIATHGRGAWEIATAKLQAGVALAASPTSSTYGDNVTLTATVTGAASTNPTGTVTFKDGLNTLGTSSLTVTAPFTASFSTTSLPAGTRSLTATYNGDGNYDPNTSAVTSFSVAQTPLTVTANNKSRNYGDPNPPLDGTITGIKNGDNITATYNTTATPASPVGTYPIVPTLNDPDGKLGNYSVTITNGTLSVGAITLTVTADNKTKLLNAPNPPFTVSYSGFVNGDTPASLSGTLSCGTNAVLNSPIGSYPITCSGQTSPNYTIVYVPGTLKILYASSGNVDGEPGHAVLPPIDPTGHSVFKAGSTVPVKFRVGDVNGASIGTPGVVTGFHIIQIITGTGGVTDVNLDTTSTSSSTDFRYDPVAQQWIFNLSTKGLAARNTYVLRIELNDGSHIDFQFGLK
jgi:hypothetical protein